MWSLIVLQHEINAVVDSLYTVHHIQFQLYLVHSSNFLQTHNIGNDANIGIRGFTAWKPKNIQ